MSTSEQKKSGTRFNLFDVLLLLTVIICVGAIIAHAYFTAELSDSYTETATVSFVVSGVAEKTAEAFCKPASKIYLQENDAEIGFLSTASYGSQTLYLETAEGMLVKASHPDKMEISATALFNGTWTEDGFLIDGTTLVTIGKTLNIYTENAVCTLTITNISR